MIFINKNLLKLYIYLCIALCLCVCLFPTIFVRTINTIDYIKVKTLLVFQGNDDYETNIYVNKGNIIIMFDDGWKSQYTIGYEYMRGKDMKGSIAIIPKNIGESGYMNKANLYELYNQNWDLLNHTYDHLVLNDSNINKQIKSITRGSKWLEKNGFINHHRVLIYPEGKYNDNTIKALNNMNYTSTRGIESGFNLNQPGNLYDIKVKNILPNTKVNEVKEWINYIIDNNLTLILLFHKLDNNIDKTKMKYKKKDFYKIIDYIDTNKNNLNIITYSEWLETITYRHK
ncbi:MAG: polysaccharide deacetylase family protein [Bacilli bacterium]|nr:polysaccharide deacetylase family protein [Bacilli bacterium]